MIIDSSVKCYDSGQETWRKSDPLPQDPFFIEKLKNKDPQNGYTRKQPTHFSMAPLRSKILKKKFFSTQQIINLVHIKIAP